MAQQETTVEEFEQAIGHALHMWSHVEGALENVFAVASGMKSKNDFNVQAHIIMATIVSFEARCAVVSEIVKLSDLYTDYEKRVWAKLLDRTLRYYKKRHELAHFIVVRQFNDDNTAYRAEMIPYCSFGNELRGRRKSLTLDQIRERAGKFRELESVFTWFFAQGVARYTRRPEHEPLAPDLLLRLHELVDQSHAAPRAPLRS